MAGLYLSIVLTLLASSAVYCQDLNKTLDKVPKAKSFQFLTVVKFPNAPCVATGTRNGTCYTSDECLSKGGVSSGSCANAYGVCCVFTLACGKTSSENCTYLTLGATTATPVPAICDYTICKCNQNICRLRLDFMAFAITGPLVGTTVGAAPTTTTGGGIGDCITDTFAVTSAGNRGTPVICGSNGGQHIFVDASQECNHAVFSFGSAAFNRQYDIKITQFSCQDENGGPPDCLQYFSSNTGTIQSFNFQTTNNVVTSTATHLTSQCYTMCFRRNLNKCGICFAPTINPLVAGVANQASFGLSLTRTGQVAAQAEVDTNCISDFLLIPNGLVSTLPLAAIANVVTGMGHRFCGRFLNNEDAVANGVSICTFSRPFKVTFKTDANEVTTGAAATSDVNEQALFPGGIIGFQLSFSQISC